MNLSRASRRVAGWLIGGDVVDQTAALASTATAGASFGPGLLPRRGLDQALATGVLAAMQHGLVMTSQSGCAALARRIVPDDGTADGRVRCYVAQAAVSGGLAGAGLAAQRALAPRADEPVRRAVLRTAGQRAARAGLAAALLSVVAAGDAAVGGRRPGLRVLASGGGLLAGVTFGAWQIHRYRAGDGAQPGAVGPFRDPLTGEPAGRDASPAPSLPPVARSLLLGATVSAGLCALALAEGAAARGLTAAVRRAVPGADPVGTNGTIMEANLADCTPQCPGSAVTELAGGQDFPFSVAVGP